MTASRATPPDQVTQDRSGPPTGQCSLLLGAQERYAVTQAWAHKYPRTLAAFDRALEQGQAIADTGRAAFEAAAEKYLGIKPETAAVLNVPEYPLSVTPTQLQRVVDTMVQFGMLPRNDASFKVTAMTG